MNQLKEAQAELWPQGEKREVSWLDNPKALTTNVDFSLTSTGTVSWGVTWKTDRLPPKMGPNSYLYLLVSLGKFFVIFWVISGNHDRSPQPFLGRVRNSPYLLAVFLSRFIGSDSSNILSEESSQEGYWEWMIFKGIFCRKGRNLKASEKLVSLVVFGICFVIIEL